MEYFFDIRRQDPRGRKIKFITDLSALTFIIRFEGIVLSFNCKLS